MGGLGDGKNYRFLYLQLSSSVESQNLWFFWFNVFHNIFSVMDIHIQLCISISPKILKEIIAQISCQSIFRCLGYFNFTANINKTADNFFVTLCPPLLHSISNCVLSQLYNKIYDPFQGPFETIMAYKKNIPLYLKLNV